jgi:hypothetical protein
MSLHESRTSRRSKSVSGNTGNTGNKPASDGDLFTIARTDRLKTTEVDNKSEDISRPIRSCVSNPSRPQLTEESLLLLEQSLPGYRLAHRNLRRWFFYIESTFQDSFDTYREYPDRDFYPSCFESPLSETPLSQADFQESHHSPAGSTDIFGHTIRLTQEIQVVIPSHTSSGLPYPRLSAPSDSIESSFGSPSSESVVDHTFEPPPPASTSAPAEPLLQSSESQQPLDTRQSRSRTRPRSPSSSDDPSYHPQLASPLSLRRRITRSRSQHVSRAVIDPSTEVITLSD